uniref:LytR/AlgR family response regulator transcription factor n=1 Tax=Acetatifactor sp. TaxID=1872090 RepID=UPI004057481E
MKQILVGICDDEQFFLDELYKLVYACGNECKLDFAIDTHLSITELLKQMNSKENEYDILFLDVEMPEMTGIDAAKKLRENGYEGIICFVTSHDSYTFEAYGVEAWGYLIKPAQYENVKRLIKRAAVQIFYNFNAQETRKRYLEISTQKDNMMIDMEQILYVEKRRNQCVIHMEDGEVVCYETLKNIFPRLNQSVFCYAHQGFIVNFDKVKEVQPTGIIFGPGREAPVSRKYYKALKERKKNEIYRLKEEYFAR